MKSYYNDATSVQSAITSIPVCKPCEAFTNYPLLDHKLISQISLVLYYAQIVDQKQLFKEFFRLCKDISERKYEHCVSEFAVKAWVRHSIIKLYRKREQILTNSSSSLSLNSISNALLNVFIDVFRESKNTICKPKVKARYGNLVQSAIQGSNNMTHIKNMNTLIDGGGIFFNNANFEDYYLGVSSLHLSLPFKENNSHGDAFKIDIMHWLRRFWLKFCSQPDPTNCISQASGSQHHRIWENKNICNDNKVQEIFSCCSNGDLSCDELNTSISCNKNVSDSGSWNCSEFNDISQLASFSSIISHSVSKSNATSHHFTEADSSSVGSTAFEDAISKARLKSTSLFTEVDATKNQLNEYYRTWENENNCNDNNVQKIFPRGSNGDLTYDELNTSISSDENNSDSGSWNCSDFDDIAQDSSFSSVISRSVAVSKRNATLSWLKSTSRHFNDADSGSDESIVFENTVSKGNATLSSLKSTSPLFTEVDATKNQLNEYYRTWENENNCNDNVQKIFPRGSNGDLTCDELNTSISSDENNSDSGSWNCSDFDDIAQDSSFNSVISHSIAVSKCNATLSWLKSTSRHFNDADSGSDESIVFESTVSKCNATVSSLKSTSRHFTEVDCSSVESIVFEDVITEENINDVNFQIASRGSLCWVDDSSDDDDSDVLFSNGLSTTFSFTVEDSCSKIQDYDNPYFEDNLSLFSVPKYIKTVNESWNEMMLDVKDGPREASKVSFAPESNLVTVHCFERTNENLNFDTYALDRLRFQRRIQDFGLILSPFLTHEHRVKVQQRNGFYHNQF